MHAPDNKTLLTMVRKISNGKDADASVRCIYGCPANDGTLNYNVDIEIDTRLWVPGSKHSLGRFTWNHSSKRMHVLMLGNQRVLTLYVRQGQRVVIILRCLYASGGSPDTFELSRDGPSNDTVELALGALWEYLGTEEEEEESEEEGKEKFAREMKEVWKWTALHMAFGAAVIYFAHLTLKTGRT
jgi:hypothetical protein